MSLRWRIAGRRVVAGFLRGLRGAGGSRCRGVCLLVCRRGRLEGILRMLGEGGYGWGG
jgi:hypothetical protein